jgi:uridine kinase
LLELTELKEPEKLFFAANSHNICLAISIDAIHVSIDGFHNTKEIRYKQGRDAAKGYLEDAYNETAFADKVLKSSQDKQPVFIEKIHDLETDELLYLEPIKLRPTSVLLTDGAYLFKDIFLPYWDLKIYLKNDFQVALQRGIERDAAIFGDVEQAKEKYKNRYHLASAMYIHECAPETKADIIINNTDFENLVIER